MKKKFLPLLSIIVLLPQVTFADVCSALANDTFSDLVGKSICIINKTLIPFGFALAMVIFIYGVVGYVAKGDDEEARKKGREFIIWGIIGIFMMVSIFGFVKLLDNTLKLPNDPTTPIEIPEAPVYGG
jgi:FtsH-binding integral membrane protein